MFAIAALACAVTVLSKDSSYSLRETWNRENKLTHLLRIWYLWVVFAKVHQPIQKAMLTPGFFRICQVATTFDDVCRSKIRGSVALVLKFSTCYLKLRIYWANLTLAFIRMDSQNEGAIARFNLLRRRCGRHAKHLHSIPACGILDKSRKTFFI